MRQDLIKLLETHTDVTNAIVLTHNIDFVFLQMIVLPALRRCGRPTLTVFADAQCAAESFSNQGPLLNTIGTRYRVVPIAMEPGFRFHPKALLLSGPTKATLWVGSGNLTFGGWRENAEVWVRFETEKDSTAPFSAFRSYLQDVLGRVPLAEPVQAEIDEAFDMQTRSWAKEMDPPAGLLGRVGDRPPLLEQISAAVGADPVERLVVCSPYFDPDGEALESIVARLNPGKVEVLVQKKYPGLPRSAAARQPSKVEVLPIQFTRTRVSGGLRESFVHAKFYGVTTLARTLVIAGSANCSRAALTIPGRNGNAELVALQELTEDAFQDLYLSEIPRAEGQLELSDPVEEDEIPAVPSPLRVLAARHDGGELSIAYASAPGVTVTRCHGGDIVVPFTAGGSGIGSAKFILPPSRLILEGLLHGEIVRSPECWVDVEGDLGSSARGRNLAVKVREGVQAGRWGIGAWKEVLDVFYKHLQYQPPRATGWGTGGHERRGQQLAEFTAEDVFAPSYGLPNLGSAARAAIGEDRVQSLKMLLLRWFGTVTQDETPAVSDEPEGNEDSPGDEEEIVDRPEQFPKGRHQSHVPKPHTDDDRRRALESLKQITTAMSTEGFLAQRSPELLASDLKIAAVLLRVGLKEDWIGETDFFEATRVIWSSLFFSSPGRPDQGWLERRYRGAEDPDAFALRMASPELSAALAGWSNSTLLSGGTPEMVRHSLAQVLAVARLPWLWRGGNTERITQELGKMLAVTGGSFSAEAQQRTEADWLRLIRRGDALSALEACLNGHTPAEIRGKISRDQVPRGELLWQGKSGYCVVLDNCQRSQRDSVKVLRLQGDQGMGSFSPGFLIPLRALLDIDVFPATGSVNSMQRDTIHDMLDEISGNFRPT